MSETYRTRQTLLNKLRHQDNDQAWEEFVHFYRRYIWAILQKVGVSEADLEDLTQQVLIKIWSKMDQFDYNQARGRFRNWLSILVRNQAYDFLRSQVRKSEKQQQIEAALYPSHLTKWEELTNAQWKRHLASLAYQTVSQNSSENMIEAFNSQFRDESVEEVAARLDLDPNTIYTYRKRIKEKLAEEVRRLKELLD